SGRTLSRSKESLLAEGYQRFRVYDEMKEFEEVHTLTTLRSNNMPKSMNKMKVSTELFIQQSKTGEEYLI
ncbi:MAG: hypothetical protein QXN95_06325, partial [Candidatus Bathyarchaeia archaeon]